MSVSPAIARIQRHLATLPGDIGCWHLARDRDGVAPGVLVDLGLVKPIVSRVPRCAAHGCPLLATCEHVADFEPEASGSKAGVKYRRTAEGDAATADGGIVLGAVRELPVAADVLDILQAGPATIFALNTHFLDRARQAARAGRNPEPLVVSRVTLGAVLGLLIEVGLVAIADDGVTYRPASTGVG